MEQIEFEKLLLNTAFCCMSSDGAIDPKEVELIKSIFSKYNRFSSINLEEKINSFINILNQKGKGFFIHYFGLLDKANLNEEQELNLIQIAIDTINADEVVEYSEIKFFKNIRHRLKISDDAILSKFPDIEIYLEEDIKTDSLLDKITNQYFDSIEIPKFDLLTINKEI